MNTASRITPAQYGEQIAATWPPLTDEQVEEIAKILATVEVEQVAA